MLNHQGAYSKACKELSLFASQLKVMYVQEHQNYGNCHHSLLGPQRIPKHVLDAWVEDEEHGFVHGVLTAFWAMIRGGMLGEHSARSEHLLASCILHDFGRFVGEEERHDQRLREWFPNLWEETYSHSTGLNSPITFADRHELLRYEDWQVWVDLIKVWQRTPNEEELAYHQFFYQHIRPALSSILQDNGQLWLRHYPEEEDAERTRAITWRGKSEWLTPHSGWRRTDPLFYPSSHWCDPQGRWPAEHGKLWTVEGIGRLLVGDRESFGLLRQDEYKRIVPDWSMSIARDHLMCSGEVPINRWLFLTVADQLPPQVDFQNSKGVAPLRPALEIAASCQQIFNVLFALRAA